MRAQNYIKSVTAKKATQGHEVDVNRSAIDAIQNLIGTLAIAVQALETVDARHIGSVADGIDFFAEVNRFEMQMITQALRLAKGSQKRAARLLNMNPTTLNTKIKVYKIDWKAEMFD